MVRSSAIKATGLFLCIVSFATTAPVTFSETANCAAIWQRCGGGSQPSCCMGACACNGTSAYKQCVPPQGQWQCGTPEPTPTPPPPPTPPVPPTPTPPPPPTPPVPPTPTPPLPPAQLDIIGYYGNSGNAVASIPKLADIHGSYNVLILTFASVDAGGNFSLDIQGPYEHDLPGLAEDMKTWKAVKDKYGRRRLALFSIGGQNGHWSGLPASTILAGMTAFMEAYHLDGLDIDLEGPSVGSASSLLSVVDTLTKMGKIVTAAPEAAYGPLVAYEELLPHLSWVHPQFYNNGPNAVMTPFVPPASLWPTPWTVRDWQDESKGQAFWAGVLDAIGNVSNLTTSQLGMLIPATSSAAGNNNQWDEELLAKQVKAAGVTHVGTWAVAYDNTQDWKLGRALERLLLAIEA